MSDRKFSVHARHIDSHHARLVSESSFVAAAIAYVEDLETGGESSEISVIVRDVASGHEQCFRIDLDTGEVNGCG